MKTLLCLLAFVGLVVSAHAQNIVPTTVVGNSALTNVLVVRPISTNNPSITTAPVKLYAVTGQNTSGSTIYIQIHQSTTNPATGAIPVFCIPVGANQFYSYDFSYYGVNLDSCTITASTSASTNNPATAVATIQAIIHNP